MNALHIPRDWRDAAEHIERSQRGRILVLGATDRGKSTFCAFLAWYLLRHGHRPAYVDADVGQKDIGPPATISLGYPALNQALETLPPAALYFVGAVTPLAHLLPMVVGTRKLAEQAGRPFVLVNTSGLVTEVGEILKTFQIDSLQPDWIVTLERDRELEAIVAAHRHFPVLRLAPSPLVRSKSPELRRRRRLAAFRHYFRHARSWRIPVSRLILQRLPAGEIRPWEEIFTPNRLCALADRRQAVLGLALIRDYDAGGHRLTLYTPVRKECPILQLGDLHVILD